MMHFPRPLIFGIHVKFRGCTCTCINWCGNASLVESIQVFLIPNTDSKEPLANHENRSESSRIDFSTQNMKMCLCVRFRKSTNIVGFYSQNHLSFYGLIIPMDSELEPSVIVIQTKHVNLATVLSQSPRGCFGMIFTLNETALPFHFALIKRMMQFWSQQNVIQEESVGPV